VNLTHVGKGERERSIPSLDGLRAFSVLSVILGHLRSPQLDAIPLLQPFRQGELGVAMFFVISGFLITHLLLKERSEAGGIDLRAFYLRRTLRIFPPFYAFVAIVGIMTMAGACVLPRAAFLFALTYTWNIGPYSGIWIFGHLWSLSLEEQFYLIWPSFVKRLRSAANLRNVAAFFFVAPLVRIAAFLLVPPVYQQRIHTTLLLLPDHFLAGCAIALAMDADRFDRLLPSLGRLRYAAPSALYLYIIDPYLDRNYRAFRPLIGYSTEALCIGIILVYVVLRPNSVAGRLLNLRPVRHIGLISYSLYLWQQMFTGLDTERFVKFPANLIAIFLCAEASYWVIERPALALKRRLTPGKGPLIALVPVV
jgi:peptidoglycan/LPS O-acetylase OafA/YrhL